MIANEVVKMLSLVNLAQSIGDLLVFGLAYYSTSALFALSVHISPMYMSLSPVLGCSTCPNPSRRDRGVSKKPISACDRMAQTAPPKT